MKGLILLLKITYRVSGVLLLILAFSSCLYAQSFDANGLFKPTNNGTIYPKASTIPFDTAATLSEDQKTALKKTLLQRVKAAIYNLQDDSIGLKAIYTQIWDENFYKSQLDDLKGLQSYLEGNDPGHSVFTYTITPAQIETLYTLPLFVKPVEDPVNETPTQQAFNLPQNDVLANWLLKTYNDNLAADTSINKLQMDYYYISEWRRLEDMYTKIKDIRKKATAMGDDIFTYSQATVDDLKSQLTKIKPGDLQLVTTIKNSPFIKQWLWYNLSLPALNPLQVTTPDKKYPATEKNTFFTADKQKLLDTLYKNSPLSQFQTNAKYANRLFLHVKDPDDKDHCTLYEFDAAAGYTQGYKMPENMLDNKQKLRFALYNIPAGRKISFVTSQQTLVYESRAVQQLNTLADQISTVTTLGASNVATFAKVAGLVNPNNFNHVGLGVAFQPYNDIAFNTELYKDNFNKYLQNVTPLVPDSKKANAAPNPPAKEVYINNVRVPLTGEKLDEDKRRILWVGASTSNTVDINSPDDFFSKLMEAFIKGDQYNFLDYTNIDDSVQALQTRFNNFQDLVKQHLAAIQDLAKKAGDTYKMVDPYIRIANRSLPPDKLKAITDTVPALSTFLAAPVIPDAPAKFIYSLTEQDAKGKTPAKPIAQGTTLKVIQTQRFDFSIGFAYTFSQYTMTHDGTPLPTTAIGDAFQFTGGLHWYPIKPLNRLHDQFIGDPKERFSVYAGLSIQHALDHYFLGVSYDLFPGVRLVGGSHIFRNYHFQIIDNQVADKAAGFANAGFFLSLNVEPVTIVKAVNIFK